MIRLKGSSARPVLQEVLYSRAKRVARGAVNSDGAVG